MASIISRFPEGLLAFLDSKSRGQNPFQLGDVVTPGLELAPFYELGGNPRHVLVLTTGPNAASEYGNFGPATGEVWLVRSAYVLIRAGASGDGFTGTLQMRRGGALPTHVLAQANWPAGFAAAGLGEALGSWQPTWPMFVRPGDEFYGRVDTTTAAPAAITVGVAYTPFQA